MATMWNLLAGYAGLVSVGQQAFIGLGAYFVLILAMHGTNPFLALPLAAVGCGVIGLPVWWIVSRLRSGYFAIATWVVASVCEALIIRFPSLGGGTGTPLPGLGSLDPILLTAYTFWVSLAVLVVVLAAAYLILRSRVGLVLTAIGDDEIGGIGTIEGPILGTILFFVLQENLSSYGAWYLIILGLVAIAVGIWARRGLWGLIADRWNIRVFPVGYYLWLEGQGRPLSRGPLRGAPSGGPPAGHLPPGNQPAGGSGAAEAADPGDG